MSCVAAWHVTKPQVVVMHGAVTDNNATLFAQGYDSVINPLLQVGEVDRRGSHGRHLGFSDGRDRVPGRLHGAPDHQCGADPQ